MGGDEDEAGDGGDDTLESDPITGLVSPRRGLRLRLGGGISLSLAFRRLKSSVLTFRVLSDIYADITGRVVGLGD